MSPFILAIKGQEVYYLLHSKMRLLGGYVLVLSLFCLAAEVEGSLASLYTLYFLTATVPDHIIRKVSHPVDFYRYNC